VAAARRGRRFDAAFHGVFEGLQAVRGDEEGRTARLVARHAGASLVGVADLHGDARLTEPDHHAPAVAGHGGGGGAVHREAEEGLDDGAAGGGILAFRVLPGAGLAAEFELLAPELDGDRVDLPVLRFDEERTRPVLGGQEHGEVEGRDPHRDVAHGGHRAIGVGDADAQRAGAAHVLD
jgi:hypothetical protein